MIVGSDLTAEGRHRPLGPQTKSGGVSCETPPLFSVTISKPTALVFDDPLIHCSVPVDDAAIAKEDVDFASSAFN